MATYTVPASVIIECTSPEKAVEAAKKINELLSEGMVKTVLSANGLIVKSIVVFQPVVGTPKFAPKQG